MKRTIVLLLIALFAVMALSAASKNTGMDISKCENSAVTSFVSFLTNNGIMDKYFPEYGIFQKNNGIYHLDLVFGGCDYEKPIKIYFCDTHIELYWDSGIYMDDYKGKYDDTSAYVISEALSCVGDYTNKYIIWASLSCYGNPYELYSGSAMAFDGLSSQSIAEAVWGRLRDYIWYSIDGFDYVKERLIEYYNTYK